MADNKLAGVSFQVMMNNIKKADKERLFEKRFDRLCKDCDDSSFICVIGESSKHYEVTLTKKALDEACTFLTSAVREFLDTKSYDMDEAFISLRSIGIDIKKFDLDTASFVISPIATAAGMKAVAKLGVVAENRLYPLGWDFSKSELVVIAA